MKRASFLFLCKDCIAHFNKGNVFTLFSLAKEVWNNWGETVHFGLYTEKLGHGWEPACLSCYTMMGRMEKYSTRQKNFFLCVFFSFPKSYVNFISFFFLCTFSWVVEFQDVVDFESSRFIFEVDQWLKTDDHMMTQDICYYN